MKTVLFLNHKVQNCGIYQEGKRDFELIYDSKLVNYVYKEVSSLSEYADTLSEINPDFIIFNWCITTMPWYQPDLYLPSRAKQYFIFHDPPIKKYYDKYILFGERNLVDGIIDHNNKLDVEKYVTLPRPLFKYTNIYPDNDIPTIGSFGLMSSWHKGFDEITKRVNREFERAVINLHFSWSYYCDSQKILIDKMVDACRKENTNPGVELNITHELYDSKELLDFLARNDINIFYYRPVPQIGLSSSIDLALSVNRPLAVTNSPPFKHVYKDEIDINKHTIKEIMDLGTKPLEELYKKWSASKFSEEMDRLFV